ncbi:NAD(P)-binding protein [Dichomitus squalens]|uniref:NAD(P)-binding protein n=1 Tax=Dichomitus squalens TaxID=114155 RepID=A0A4Q9MXD8_9APHY|nr:NAD(P)-binding protein [Dichomitus squalens]
MAPVTNGRVLFNEYLPTGYPIPGKTVVYDTSETIDLENVALNGGFLVKVLVLSIDPYQRNRLKAPSDQRSYGSFELGKPIQNFGVGVVLRSENSAVKAGDHVYGQYDFQQYVIVPELPSRIWRVLENKEQIPWSAYVGVAGMPGQTAYYGWKEYASPQKGEVAFVTTGAGPVGATVIQLAKADGLKVIASAGSDDKVEYMKSIGADVAFNYKTTKTSDVLAKEGPIHVFWDNVGGESFEAAIEHAATGARLLECGMITVYNTNETYTVKNLFQIIGKELHIHGVMVAGPLHEKYVDEFYETIPEKIARGELKYKEHVLHGLDKAGQGLLDVQTGKNFGKCVIVVAEE